MESYIPPLSLYLQAQAYKYKLRVGYKDRALEKEEVLLWVRKRVRPTRRNRARTRTRTLISTSTLTPSLDFNLLEEWKKLWDLLPRDKWGLSLPPLAKALAR